ncbi:hypothetical protein [Streptomyces sp. CB01881]|uniref:hypothetical protein n=1 Tax=Streptomyces sp. CB01881 TaxID=2078691 RepID=UPI0011DF29CE|nr:hypothetical protein [Streptomyces sp. CB01881]TYC76530.1 hypothetical protein EH183_02640 [Streptomyces sp. CB01881]
MDSGGTNETAETASEERELSTGAMVAVTVLAAVGAVAVMLAVFHWLGWTFPGLGWLLAKGAVKLCAGGAVGLVAAVAWLRQQRSGRR